MGALSDIVRASERLLPETRAVYGKCVDAFETLYPDPRTWTARHVEMWRSQLQVAGFKAQTVNKYLYALRYASRRYEALGFGDDFARAAESARGGKAQKRRALSVEEAQGLLAACRAADGSLDLRAVRDHALIVLGIRTGLRVSELAGLRWQGIDGRKATVRAKGGRPHTVYLDDECLGALTLLEVESGGSYRRPAAVFVDIATGRPLSRKALHGILARRGRKAGLGRAIHPHLLRHTFISWAVAAGVPVQRIMIMTGHRSLQTLSGYVTDLEAETDPVGHYLPALGKRRS